MSKHSIKELDEGQLDLMLERLEEEKHETD